MEFLFVLVILMLHVMVELKMMMSFKSSEDCERINKSNAMNLQCYFQSSATSCITNEWIHIFAFLLFPVYNDLQRLNYVFENLSDKGIIISDCPKWAMSIMNL